MPLGVVVLMIKLALLIETTAAQAPQFVQVPTSVNISAGSTAVFSCIAISTGQFWLINNLASSHVNHDLRNVTTEGPDPVPDGPEGSSKYTMRVPTIDINNNIEIRCSIYLGTKVNSSNPCFLRIQGLLGPVSNLTASQFNSTAISVHFKHPNTLAGVPLMYMIHVSSDDGTTDTHINTTSEGYQYVTHNWCPLYTFNITSVNGAGLGGTSAVSLALKNAPVFEGLVDYTVWFSSLTHISIHIAFLVTYECLVKYPLNITLELVSTSYNHSLMLGPCLLGGTELNHLLEWCPVVDSDKNPLRASVNLTESMLQLHTQYSMRVHATNIYGNASTAAVNFSTGFVQDASAQLHLIPKSQICVRCTFAEGDYQSRGCLSQIMDEDTGGVVKSFLVPRTGQHRLSQNCEDAPQSAGSYRVVIYDTDSSGAMLGKQPVFVINGVFVISAVETITEQQLPTPQQTSFGSGVQRGTPFSTSTQSSEALEANTLLVSVIVTGVVITFLLVVAVAILLGCLIHSKKKPNNLKVAMRSDSRVGPPVSQTAIYDNAQEILAVGATNPQAMTLQQCVAYGHLPFQKS